MTYANYGFGYPNITKERLHGPLCSDMSGSIVLMFFSYGLGMSGKNEEHTITACQGKQAKWHQNVKPRYRPILSVKNVMFHVYDVL